MKIFFSHKNKEIIPDVLQAYTLFSADYPWKSQGYKIVELNRQTAVGVLWKSISCMIIHLIIILQWKKIIRRIGTAGDADPQLQSAQHWYLFTYA